MWYKKFWTRKYCSYRGIKLKREPRAPYGYDRFSILMSASDSVPPKGYKVTGNNYAWELSGTAKDKKEADLIIEGHDCIYPIEINKGINTVSSNFNFKFLEKYGKKVMKGLLIDSREDLFPINEDNRYLPIYMIGL